jgi:hypothetical protein
MAHSFRLPSGTSAADLPGRDVLWSGGRNWHMSAVNVTPPSYPEPPKRFLNLVSRSTAPPTPNTSITRSILGWTLSTQV